MLTARHDAPPIVASAQGLGLDALLPAGLGALLPNLRELTVFPCSLTPAARTTELQDAPSLARLEKLTLYSLKVEDHDDNPRQQVTCFVCVCSCPFPAVLCAHRAVARGGCCSRLGTYGSPFAVLRFAVCVRDICSACSVWLLRAPMQRPLR